MANNFTVRTERDAWNLLEAWLSDKPIGMVEFDGWPKLAIDIKGDDYSSSLQSGQLEALIDFKMSMGRAYASIAHGAYDMRRLRRDEEEKLEFTTTVRQGSTLTETDLSPLVQALAQLITTHPIETVIGGVIVGLAFVAKPIIAKHFEDKAKRLETDSRDKLVRDLVGTLSASENERLKIFEAANTKIQRTYPQFALMLPDASAAFWRLASASANADQMEVSGVKLNKDHLDILSERRTSRESVVKSVTDDFLVTGIVKVQNVYRIQMHSKKMHISAQYRAPEKTDSRVKKLITCMTSSQLIRAEVQIKTIDKSQIVGRLLKFQPLPHLGVAEG